jgi:hypothetical protein
VIGIDILPDDVLLGIFDSYIYVEGHPLFVIRKTDVEKWHSLAHVCGRWRSLVFGSPHRLNLQLCCTPSTDSDALDVWPALPLLIQGDIALTSSVDNIIVALGHANRVCQVSLWETSPRRMEKVLVAMQVPFPNLTKLQLESRDETLQVIPDSFLGGSTPRLQVLRLDGIPFPGLPKLLLSANHLVNLYVAHIPHSGYISPDAMVALLSMLSSLEWLSLGFESPQSCPAWRSRRPPPSKRSIIPSLTSFDFIGVSEYLEDLVTYIDAPQLDYTRITFFNQIDFDIPQLAQFIGRTPAFRACDEAHVQFGDIHVDVELTSQTHGSDNATSWIEISCKEPDWQLSSIAQVCNSSLPPISTIEDLYIRHYYSQLVWETDAIENNLWLELLLPFTAMKNLYLSKEFAPGIAAALQELIRGRIAEVLPSLQNIFVKKLEPSGRFSENIGEFVAARQLSGHPVAISVWNGEEEEIAPLPFVPPTAETVKIQRVGQ